MPRSWSVLLRDPAPFLVAHRGYAARFPENTLPAFEAAVEEGAETLELDVQPSRDGVPLVLHDDTLDRTTNGTGDVADHDARDIEALDAGAWFGPAFRGVRVPTLDAVLERLGGRIAIDVELKASPRAPRAAIDHVTDAALARVAELGLEDHVLFSSFDPRPLRRLRAARDDLHLALAVERVPPPATLAALVRELRPAFVAPDADLLLAPELEALAEAGLPVIPYTLNAAPVMRRWLRAGVRGFFSDEVEVARGILREA